MKKRRPSFRHLRLESLDDRRMMATFTVDTLLDEADGNYSAGDFSLREAIARANTTPATLDTIEFAPDLSGTIELLAGELKITSSLTIEGTKALRIAIDGNDQSRIFNVAASGDKISVRIHSMELRGGKALAGGAIHNDGETVTLQRVYLHDNHSSSAGGAIFATSGALMNIANSTLANNHADAQGGGVFVQYAALNVTNTTISGNHAEWWGGGISVGKVSKVKIVNATITNNVAGEQLTARAGGGISSYYGTGSVVALHNSIVYNNRRTGIDGTYNNDVTGTLQLNSQNNIIGTDSSNSREGTGGLINGLNGNQIEIRVQEFRGRVLDPQLRRNNGVMPTHALLDQSLAVDAGNINYAVDHWGDPLNRDQNGYKRIVNNRPGFEFQATIDIGAVEVQSPELITNRQGQTYRLGDPPILVSPTADLIEKNRGSFGGGSITIKIQFGAGEESLGFQQDSDFTIIGGQIRVLGRVVASYSGGWGSNPLGISFVQDATVEEAEKVLQHLTYSRISIVKYHSKNIFAELRDGGGGYATAGLTTIRTIVA
jgi:hypothetical protein